MAKIEREYSTKQYAKRKLHEIFKNCIIVDGEFSATDTITGYLNHNILVLKSDHYTEDELWEITSNGFPL